MPTLKTYDIFISHAWGYNEDYYKIENMLLETELFMWRNYSVPQHDPLIDPNTHAGKRELIDLLEKQIKPVNCVLILGGMYTVYSEWILKEIELAGKYNKPIIGVYPRGQVYMPKVIQEVAKDIVSWNRYSIVSSIRQFSI